MEQRVGRPRTYKEEARTQTITVRVTAGTHARLNAEAAQAGKSLAGLAEHYISKGNLSIESADNQMSPTLIAEIKRLCAELQRVGRYDGDDLPPEGREAAFALHELLQLVLRDELISQRVHNIRSRNSANDSTPPSSRDEFQRVVHVRSSRSEGDNG